MNLNCFLQQFSTGDFNTFIRKFEILATAQEWNDETKKLKMLPIYFEGEAQEYYLSLPEATKTNFKDLCNGFRLRFRKNEIAIKAELTCARKMANETYAAFAVRINNLTSQCYHSLDVNAIKLITKDKFLDGIDPTMRKNVLLEKELVELDAIVEKCEWIQAVQKIEEAETHVVSAEEDKFKSVDARLDDIVEKLESLKLSSESINLVKSNTKKTICCFNCGRNGHIAKNCWYNKNNSVFSVIDTRNTKGMLTTEVDMNQIIVEGIIDTGSSISILSENFFNHNFSHLHLKKSFVLLNDAQGNKMSVVGKVLLVVTKGDIKFEHFFLVVINLSKDCILGLDILNKLKFTICFQPNSQEYAMCMNTLVNKDILKSCYVPTDTHNEQDISRIPSEINKILTKFPEVFDGKLGRCKVGEHSIKLSSDKIIKVPPRIIPLHYRTRVKEIVYDLLEKGVIRHSKSQFSSPAVLVPKKSGDIRICVDYRQLNVITEKNAYPLPLVSEVHNRLKGSTIFSTIDLSNGYWQIKMSPKDIAKTAFSLGHEYGLLEFTVMPFGLTGAPGTFQSIMNKIFWHLEFVIVYLDDIIIFSPDIETRKTHLKPYLNLFMIMA